MNLKEYKISFKKKHGEHKFKNSGLFREASYDFVKKNGKGKFNTIKKAQTEYSKILRAIHEAWIEDFTKGFDITFPQHMGKLVLRKNSAKPKIVNGKLKIRYKIDWDKTLELWYNDKEAEKNKTLIRMEVPEIYKISYMIDKYCSTNSRYLTFKPCREFKIKLKGAIQNNSLDTIYLNN